MCVCVLVNKSFSGVEVASCLEYVCKMFMFINIAAHCVTLCIVSNCFHFMCVCLSTRPLSVSVVSMTMTLTFCSHTLLQKFVQVCGSGP